MQARQIVDASNLNASQSEPWRVYRVNDYEWWLARSLEEARVEAAKCWGYTLEEAHEDDLFDDVHELSDEELERFKFLDDSQHPVVRRTFRVELAIRLEVLRAGGKPIVPQIFAATDW